MDAVQTPLDEPTGTWRSLLIHHGLLTFKSLWNLEAPWVEEPNLGRGGWSGVKRVTLDQPGGEPEIAYLKCQEEFSSRSWRHPIKGQLTIIRENQRRLELAELGIPVPDLVFFGLETFEGKRRAIFMTAALPDGSRPLDDWMSDWQQHGWPDRLERTEMIKAAALLIRRMHDARIQHNGLYARHLFLRRIDGKSEFSLIDFEKSRPRRIRFTAQLRDLDTLNRRTGFWSTQDRLRFLIAYLPNVKERPLRRRLLSKLLKRWKSGAKNKNTLGQTQASKN